MMLQSPRVGAQVRHPGFWPVPPNSMRPSPKVKMGRMGQPVAGWGASEEGGTSVPI